MYFVLWTRNHWKVYEVQNQIKGITKIRMIKTGDIGTMYVICLFIFILLMFLLLEQIEMTTEWG